MRSVTMDDVKEKGYWVCEGPIRGDCGHKHEYLQEARRCLVADRRGCRIQGGNSDRVLIWIGDGPMPDIDGPALDGQRPLW